MLMYWLWEKLVVQPIEWRAYRDKSGYHLPGYMLRHWVIKYREWEWLERWPLLGYIFTIGVRLHTILRSDRDRHAHDHPWWSISVILRNSYIEWVPRYPRKLGRSTSGHYEEEMVPLVRKPGDIVFRRATSRHRLELNNGPVLSLFIMGPWVQDWGFYVPNLGKILWRAYLNEWRD